MELTDVVPQGRVPRGEPGHTFYRGRDTAVPPLQKGNKVHIGSQALVDEIPPPAFIQGGDYMVYACKYEGKHEHAVVALLEGDVPIVWLVQCDETFQGDAAKELMGPDYRWTRLKPESCVMDAHRAMMRADAMYPEVKRWALVVDWGDKTEITSSDESYRQYVKGALLQEN